MRRLLVIGTLSVSLVISGCFSPSRYVIVRVGAPIQVLDNVTVKSKRIGDNTLIKQDVGGWIAMPEGHYAQLMEWAEAGFAMPAERGRAD